MNFFNFQECPLAQGCIHVLVPSCKFLRSDALWSNNRLGGLAFRSKVIPYLKDALRWEMLNVAEMTRFVLLKSHPWMGFFAKLFTV